VEDGRLLHLGTSVSDVLTKTRWKGHDAVHLDAQARCLPLRRYLVSLEHERGVHIFSNARW
jgi:hypothetical protein